jgi:hypothetical protein
MTANRHQFFGYSRSPEDLWTLNQVIFTGRKCSGRLKRAAPKAHDSVANLSKRDSRGGTCSEGLSFRRE